MHLRRFLAHIVRLHPKGLTETFVADRFVDVLSWWCMKSPDFSPQFLPVRLCFWKESSRQVETSCPTPKMDSSMHEVQNAHAQAPIDFWPRAHKHPGFVSFAAAATMVTVSLSAWATCSRLSPIPVPLPFLLSFPGTFWSTKWGLEVTEWHVITTYNDIKRAFYQPALADGSTRRNGGKVRNFNSYAALITCLQCFGTGTAPSFSVTTWQREGRLCFFNFHLPSSPCTISFFFFFLANPCLHDSLTTRLSFLPPRPLIHPLSAFPLSHQTAPPSNNPAKRTLIRNGWTAPLIWKLIITLKKLISNSTITPKLPPFGSLCGYRSHIAN